jgi:hypothetical protein
MMRSTRSLEPLFYWFFAFLGTTLWGADFFAAGVFLAIRLGVGPNPIW